jgi:predicted restriction endonuclease
MASQRTAWSRDELPLAINLYYRTPFGRQHSRNPEIVDLANRLGRTPGSVAMKLNNLTSLDPDEAARGVRGLSKASALDREVWREFHSDWEAMAARSEALWDAMSAGSQQPQGGVEVELEIAAADFSRAETEGTRTSKVRYAQSYFRRAVLAAYENRCCITGNPVPELLVASHILPWANFPTQRVNPANGLCLSRLHDAAFDAGLITFDEKDRLVLSKSLKEYLPSKALQENFLFYEGRPLTPPIRFRPRPDFLQEHRERSFRG